MEILTIVILVIVLLSVWWLVNRLFFTTDIIYDMMCTANTPAGTDALNPNNLAVFSSNKNAIFASNIPENNTHNFMLSVWFYIDSWTTTANIEKNILYLGTAFDVITQPELQTSMSGMSAKQCGLTDNLKNINIALDKYENNLFIDIETIPESNDCEGSWITRYAVKNIPVQKWNNLTISVDTKTLDVYLDGKLRNSFIMHGVYKNKSAQNLPRNMYLGSIGTTNPGFEGFITRVRYEPNSINPQTAYDIYRKGISGSLAQSMFNKFRLKVSFLEYNKEAGSFTV